MAGEMTGYPREEDNLAEAALALYKESIALVCQRKDAEPAEDGGHTGDDRK